MQYAFPQGHQGYTYPHFRGPEEPRYFYHHRPHPPPTTNHYTPHNHGYPAAYYPSGSSNYISNNPFTGHVYNAGGNRYDGHGIQRNGNVKIGNNGSSKKRKNRKTTIVGGCHNNQGGHQVSGDVILGDFY
uniref:Uncharacterized protein n=1 Tax=Chenopodium quinoa TaxID=63459 RepID=A0A803LPF8_CHEQI